MRSDGQAWALEQLEEIVRACALAVKSPNERFGFDPS